MRRPPFILLDPMKLPQVFTGGLRAEFADAACALVPEYLATLTRRLDGDNEVRIWDKPNRKVERC